MYKSSILFVLPSFRETFGHTLVEAMAAEVPIIAANTTAIPEILGKAGLLFDPHNTEDLTKKIVEVIVNNKIRKELIKKGKNRVKSFSWKKTAEETLKVFKEAMQ